MIHRFTLFLLFAQGVALAQRTYTLQNERLLVQFDERGNLTQLVNRQTGHNYASGGALWRLQYDTKTRRDIEVTPAANRPVIEQRGLSILIRYSGLVADGNSLSMALSLTVSLEPAQVRFCAEVSNREPHTVVRELQYPLVANCQLPADHHLLTTYWGGQRYADPKRQIAAANAAFPPYYPPSQHFLQMDQKYPTGWAGGGLAANCFAFTGPTQGIYFGSHDDAFQDTGHGLRLYPSRKFVFDRLEAGFYKYPNCLTGQTWRCEANVIAPYSGSWHETARLYRAWVDTWWKHRLEPQWVRELNGWQRIIMTHQYGERFFPYSDLGTRVRTVGEGVGINSVLVHGWHRGGHDNDYPNYLADPSQGGETALKNQIEAFQRGGGSVLLYYSGRLIDKASDFYRTGGGQKLVIRDNTGSEISDAYRFRGRGTFTGSYDSRTFAVAEFRNPVWQKKLHDMAGQALRLGARSVFYDQMGWGEQPHWDLSKEFPVPYLKTIAHKSAILGQLHDFLHQRNPDVAIGIELLTDVTAMQVDYVHSRYGATDVLNPDWEARGEKPRTTNFIDWFRFTFPEIILSDRDIRDDTDIERRVNHTVLKGLRNDVEIYRCRALIDETPHYQAHLTQINALKSRFKDLLLLGRYTDTRGFDHTNPDIEARRFEQDNLAAVVLTQSHLPDARTTLTIPVGWTYAESGSVGTVTVTPGAGNVQVGLGKHGLAVVVFKKTS